mmetsp:Transcript_79340/g.229477  ORF Transcript_79340/g.229477 Transcript_79340/m.229477 type:complete len:209 (+) Transcript_79340:93-719(+)
MPTHTPSPRSRCARRFEPPNLSWAESACPTRTGAHRPPCFSRGTSSRTSLGACCRGRRPISTTGRGLWASKGLPSALRPCQTSAAAPRLPPAHTARRHHTPAAHPLQSLSRRSASPAVCANRHAFAPPGAQQHPARQPQAQPGTRPRAVPPRVVAHAWRLSGLSRSAPPRQCPNSPRQHPRMRAHAVRHLRPPRHCRDGLHAQQRPPA